MMGLHHEAAPLPFHVLLCRVARAHFPIQVLLLHLVGYPDVGLHHYQDMEKDIKITTTKPGL